MLWLYRGGRLLLGFMFIVAGVIKISNPAALAVTIDAFGIAPQILVYPISIILPVVEIVAGLGLLADVKGALGTVSLMTLIFIAVLGYGMWLGLDIDCGCYGPQDPEAEAFSSIRTSFYRDLAMLSGCFFLYWWRWLRGIKARSCGQALALVFGSNKIFFRRS